MNERRESIPLTSPKEQVLQSLRRIATTSTSSLHLHANRVGSLLSTGALDVTVAPGNHGGIRPWITNFTGRVRSEDQVLRGVIEIEPARITPDGNQRFDAEMVRTLSVAIQFDSVAYLTPLRDVYVTAVKVQENWLKNRKTVMMDPRGRDHKIIVRNLLGDEVYYGDFGFVHWGNAMKELLIQELGTNRNQARISALERMINDYESFKYARAMHGKHPEFKGSFNPDLHQKYDEIPFEALALGNAVRAIEKIL